MGDELLEPTEAWEILRNEIKAWLLLKEGIKLSDDDPVFAYLLGNQRVLELFSNPILAAISELPKALEASLQTLVLAVEASEKASSDLSVETQGALRGIAKVELESAHAGLKEAIQGTVEKVLTSHLEQASKEASKLERQMKALGAASARGKSSLVTTCLALSLLVVTCVSSVSGYVLYQAAQESKLAAQYWHNQVKPSGRG